MKFAYINCKKTVNNKPGTENTGKQDKQKNIEKLWDITSNIRPSQKPRRTWDTKITGDDLEGNLDNRNIKSIKLKINILINTL